MLIVSSLEGAHAAYAAHAPSRVISLLSDDEEVPVFEGLSPEAHLKLYVDQESCAKTINDAARRRSGEIVQFVRNWDGAGDILVHCKRGVSRSTAAAFIILCMQCPDASEAELLSRLRKAALHADPCPLLVAYADEILGRDGAMIDAVDDLSPPCTAISAPTVEIELGCNG